MDLTLTLASIKEFFYSTGKDFVKVDLKSDV